MREKCYFNDEILSNLIFEMFHQLICFENSYTVHKMVHGQEGIYKINAVKSLFFWCVLNLWKIMLNILRADKF